MLFVTIKNRPLDVPITTSAVTKPLLANGVAAIVFYMTKVHKSKTNPLRFKKRKMTKRNVYNSSKLKGEVPGRRG